MRNLVIGLAMIMAPATAQAQPATASGTYAENRGETALKPIRLTHAVALRKDDVEKVLDDDAGIWVLLSDRPVDAATLSGGIFPPAIRMAKAGTFEGILFVINDKARNDLNIRVLSRARNPGGQFESLSLSGSSSLWKSLTVTPQRVSGTMERDGISFKFDVPITSDPVQQDLQGAAARDSAIGKTLIRHADGWMAGDMAILATTMTKERFAELNALPAADRKTILAEARKSPDLANSKKIARVTIRATSATARTAAGNFDLVREDGVWKVD